MSVLHSARTTVLFAITLSVIGCRAETPRSASETRDDFGYPLAVGRPPTRIVSLNPTTTEILFAIGAGRRLVGRTQYDIFPDSAKRVPNLGPGIRPGSE